MLGTGDPYIDTDDNDQDSMTRNLVWRMLFSHPPSTSAMVKQMKKKTK